MTEKKLEIKELREIGINEANLVKKDIILILKTTLYSFLIMLIIITMFSIF